MYVDTRWTVLPPSAFRAVLPTGVRRPSGQRVVHERDVVLVDDRAPEPGVHEAHPEPVAVPKGAADGRDRAGEEHHGGRLAEPPVEAAQPVRWGEQLGHRRLLARLPRGPPPDPRPTDQ